MSHTASMLADTGATFWSRYDDFDMMNVTVDISNLRLSHWISKHEFTVSVCLTLHNGFNWVNNMEVPT